MIEMTGSARTRAVYALVALFVVPALTACGGGGATPDWPPVASPGTYSVDENSSVSGQLHATDAENETLQYSLVTAPANGTVDLDSATAHFTFTPTHNVYGPDQFQFKVYDGKQYSPVATVVVNVAHVNQPLHIAPIPDITNSPDTYELSVTVDPQDPDGDVTQFTAQTSDPATATIATSYDSQARRGKITIDPLAAGQATISVQVSDGVYSDQAQFKLTVGSVVRRVVVTPGTPVATKHVELKRTPPPSTPVAPPNAPAAAASVPSWDAVQLTNSLQLPVTFTMNVNHGLLPGTIKNIIRRATALTDAFPGEPIERKLWRLTPHSARRGQTLTDQAWQHDPVILYNSLGIGFCDDYASAYWDLITAAGLQGRVWSLNGHVVPEVFVNDRWEMYDPDLGVYYVDPQGLVAGVEELAAAPQLITNPLQITQLPERVHDSDAYSQEVADLYTTTTDNVVYPYYMQTPPERNFVFTLPPGASISFAGRWAPPPLDFYGVPIDDAVDLKLTLPAGWTGTIHLPLILAGVNGSAQLGLVTDAGDSSDFSVGSPELLARLADHSSFIEQVTIEQSSSPVELIYYINPAILAADHTFSFALVGVNVGGLTVSQTPLSDAQSPLAVTVSSSR